MWETINQCVHNPPNSEEALRPKHSFSSNLRRAERLIREDGQYGKAVKALHSNGIAKVNTSTMNALIEKHPVSALPLAANIPPFDSNNVETM